MRRALLTAALCLPLLGAHCFRSPSEIPPWDAPVRVVVRNGYAAAVEIYAVGSGIEHRLGTVHPGMEGRFEIPHAMIGSPVELQVRIGTQVGARSGRMNLQPGHTVDYDITSQVSNSFATIRP